MKTLFSGTMNRMNYLVINIALGVTLGSLMIALELLILSTPLLLLALAIILAIVVMGVVATIQRIRDTGLTMWTLPLAFVPYIGFVFGIALFFIPTGKMKETRLGA